MSNYREPSVKLSWVATFLITCMGDIVDFISRQNFNLNDPYPDGIYNCNLDYSFPSRLAGRFGLRLEKVPAPGWMMTFADIAGDLEALYYAAMWFDDQPGTVPEMHVDVYRYKSGDSGPTFLAEKGEFSFGVSPDLQQNKTEL